uniref:Zinc transporter n=2 Tax=Laurasiatheria TaxID=314145 RepID=A0A8D1GS86_PIG
MLPLSIKDDEYKPPKFNLFGKISGWFRSILSDKTSRNLFFFLCLNLSFAFVELLYGIWSNCLGLISDSFHMFFDSTAILAGLAASVISKWRDNDAFSYGYVRAEVLAGFVNGLFLIFTAFFIFSEGVERALAPPDVHHERLLLVSILGFVVNLVGIFVFKHGGHGHSHGSGMMVRTLFPSLLLFFFFFFFFFKTPTVVWAISLISYFSLASQVL